MDRKARGTLGQVKGIPLPESVVKQWPNVEKFQASKEDLLIATYPKSGKIKIYLLIYLHIEE